MSKETICQEARAAFVAAFGEAPSAGAYAPGRVEVLGNHTDYNEGFVLSAAIDTGTCFLVRRTTGPTCRVIAHNLHDEARFSLDDFKVSATQSWLNYVLGVFAKLGERAEPAAGFQALFFGDVPIGAGLSSSAALEMAAGLALGALYNIRVKKLDLARIGQAAEHDYAGARCGLLDQITSLYGRKDALVMTDFRSLDVRTVPLPAGFIFLICNTRVKHNLVESEYNERRARCEEAARFFAGALPHPVRALRDVSWDEWQSLESRMPPVTARRAAHVIGENTRVQEGCRWLTSGRIAEFGRLMFESHASSRTNFENSCPELDLLVDSARNVPAVLGARLSGGGFGGSAVLLLREADAKPAAARMAKAYQAAFGHPCETMLISPMSGATLLSSSGRGTKAPSVDR